MKTNKTISIDAEIWNRAKAKYDNVSGHIEELLSTATNTPDEEKSREELTKLVKGHEDTINVLKAELEKRMKEKKEETEELDWESKRKMSEGRWEV